MKKNMGIKTTKHHDRNRVKYYRRYANYKIKTKGVNKFGRKRRNK